MEALLLLTGFCAVQVMVPSRLPGPWERYRMGPTPRGVQEKVTFSPSSTEQVKVTLQVPFPVGFTWLVMVAMPSCSGGGKRQCEAALSSATILSVLERDPVLRRIFLSWEPLASLRKG